jgi:nicotinate dehydrogenase subunit B
MRYRAVCPDEGTTSGSQSTPTNFNQENLALAAATAREALLELAAKQFRVAAGDLAVADGVRDRSGRQVRYEQLLGNRSFNLRLNPAAKRRSHSQWLVLGKPIPSLDRVALMTGRFEFIHHVRVEGMLHGRVVRPPQMRATVAYVDKDSVGPLAGNVQVVVRENFVGVVAETQFFAAQAAAQLSVAWNPGPESAA